MQIYLINNLRNFSKKLLSIFKKLKTLFYFYHFFAIIGFKRRLITLINILPKRGTEVCSNLPECGCLATEIELLSKLTFQFDHISFQFKELFSPFKRSDNSFQMIKMESSILKNKELMVISVISLDV
ncbi:hypothetical protein BpHYR1_001415 [Brachionus plicatilis]|uniref:Uncharacterized protein n=1 Tax=Brachionus plicatilis TaxID=10195 RepID=A0A3M7RWQ1_BRAPC|nr:hypothetical protein BpHYR1_001415 [Brachionus plicatilis]